MGADTAGFGRARDLLQRWKPFPVTACSQKSQEKDTPGLQGKAPWAEQAVNSP